MARAALGWTGDPSEPPAGAVRILAVVDEAQRPPVPLPLFTATTGGSADLPRHLSRRCSRLGLAGWAAAELAAAPGPPRIPAAAVMWCCGVPMASWLISWPR